MSYISGYGEASSSSDVNLGWTFLWPWETAYAACNRSIAKAAERGVDPGLISTWQRTADMCKANNDTDGLKAISDYADRYTAGGSFTQTTAADDAVSLGLQAGQPIVNVFNAAKEASKSTLSVAVVILVAAGGLYGYHLYTKNQERQARSTT